MSVLDRGILKQTSRQKKEILKRFGKKSVKKGLMSWRRELGIWAWVPLERGWQGSELFSALHLCYFDIIRLSPEEEKELKLTYVDFETLLKRSDILTLHIPLTRRPRKLIGSKELGWMKRPAILIKYIAGRDSGRGGAPRRVSVASVERGRWMPIEPEPIPQGHPFLSSAAICRRGSFSPLTSVEPRGKPIAGCIRNPSTIF